jgi:hypothetical protein
MAGRPTLDATYAKSCISIGDSCLFHILYQTTINSPKDGEIPEFKSICLSSWERWF